MFGLIESVACRIWIVGELRTLGANFAYFPRCHSAFKIYSPLPPAWSCLLLAKLPEAGQEAWGAVAAWGTVEAEVAEAAGAEWGARVTGAAWSARVTGAGWGARVAGAGWAGEAVAGRAAGRAEGGLAGGVGLESWSVGRELASLVAGVPRAAELAPWGCVDEAVGRDSGDSAGTARE